MRILYFTQYYPPEVGATQTRAHEMSAFLAEHGHHVTIITEVPNHPSGIVPAAYRGRLSERKLENGIDVLRLWVWASPEKTFKSRMRFYLSYMSMAALAGVLIRGKYDLVYATSPPLFVGAAGLVAATVRRIPFVFEVRDLWPNRPLRSASYPASAPSRPQRLWKGFCTAEQRGSWLSLRVSTTASQNVA